MEFEERERESERETEREISATKTDQMLRKCQVHHKKKGAFCPSSSSNPNPSIKKSLENHLK